MRLLHQSERLRVHPKERAFGTLAREGTSVVLQASLQVFFADKAARSIQGQILGRRNIVNLAQFVRQYIGLLFVGEEAVDGVLVLFVDFLELFRNEKDTLVDKVAALDWVVLLVDGLTVFKLEDLNAISEPLDV